MKKQLFFLSVLMLLAFIVARAQTFVNGNISTNTTWVVANSPYVVNGGLTVDDNVTLTIEPGVIVKFSDNTGMTVYGKLLASGTQTDTIYFTSYKDDSIGGDTNGDGNSTVPAPGNWMRIYFDNADAGTLIEYCRFKYGGRYSYRWPMLDFNNNDHPVTISNSIVELSSGEGINATGTETVNITNVLSRNSEEFGFSLSNSNTNVQNCTSENNAWGLSLIPDLVENVTDNSTFQNNGHMNAIYIQGGNLTENSTWPGNQQYFIYSWVYVNDLVELTLESGAILKINDNNGMTIYGKLIANGTLAENIYFTSYKDDDVGGDTNEDAAATTPTPGIWMRLYFDSAEAGTTLDYCQIKYGGRSTYRYPQVYLVNSPVSMTNSISEYCSGEGVWVSSSETAYLTNVTCRNNEQSGFYLETDAVIQNCTSQNNDWGYQAYADMVDQIANDNTSFGNNHQDAILILGGNLTVNSTWPGNQQYYIYGGVTVNDMVELTLEPGAILKFYNSRMNIYGKLVANGTSANNICFTSYMDDTVGGDTNEDGTASSPAPGDWYNLNFDNADAGTTLDYCEVKYAGRGTYRWAQVYFGNSPASISNSIIEYCTGEGIQTAGTETVTLTNVTCRNNEQTGFYIDTDALIQNCISENNGGIGFYFGTDATLLDCVSENNEWSYSVLPDFVHQIWANNNTLINNNHSNALFVRGGNYTSNTTWIDEQMYVLEGNLSINDGSLLSLEPGVIIKFYDSDDDYRIDVYGTLVADGTLNDTIYFTSYRDDEIGGDTNEDSDATAPSNGDWYRVGFTQADVGSNLNYCSFRYGGHYYQCVAIDNSPMNISNTIVEYSANNGIQSSNCTSLNLTHVISRHNNGTGFYNTESDGINMQNCEATNNQWGYVTHPNRVQDIWDGNNSNLNNGHQNAVYIFGGTCSTNTTWIDEHQYVLGGDIILADGYSLMLEPGLIMKFYGSNYFWIYGQLLAEGTSGDPIVITSYADDSIGGDTNEDGTNTSPAPGNWEYLYLSSVDAGAQLGHCHIKYAQQGIRLDNSPMTIYNTITEYCSSWGIHAQDGNSQLTLTDVISRYNGGGVASAAQINMEDCQIIDNTGDGFNYNPDVATIDNCTFTGNGRNFYISANIVKPLLEGGNIITGNTLFDIRGGTILDDAIWDSDYLYVIHGDFTLDDNTSLIIEPGTVIKFDGQVGFTVNGSLIAQGSSAEKIVFTSFKDDSYGGDSNNNGFNNLPAKGDWNHIHFNGAEPSTILNWVIVSYAGYYGNPAIQITNSDLEAENILVIHNQDEGILCASDATFDIHFSDIYDNNGYGLINQNSTYTVQAQNNWWGDLSGPYHATLNPDGLGNAVSDYVDFEPFRDNEGSIDNPWANFDSPATSGQYFDVAPIKFGSDDFVDLVGATDNSGLKFFERTNMLPWNELTSPLPTGNYLTVCASDLNDDGMTDLIAGGANGVDVLIHDQMCGSDTCWTVTNLLNGLIVYNIYVDLINADVYPDLAVALGNNNGLRVIYGQSDGSWVMGQAPDNSTTFQKIRTADFNQDGHTDIVATNIENAGIQIWYSDQAGGWVEQDALDAGYGFWGLDVADVDFNSYPDIVASGNTPQGGILFYLNQGDDTFAQSNSPTSFGIYNDIQLKDMNGDGYFDMAAANQGAGIQTWLGNANLYWNYWYHPLETSTFKNIEISDMTLDQTPDVIAASQSDGIKIWSNRTPPVNVNPVFATSEDEIEFGEVLVTYSKTELFTIQNITADTVKEVIIYATNPVFQVYEDTVVQIPITPFDLPPGESKSMKVTYSPIAAVEENEGLIIHSIPEILMIPLTGTGVTQGVPEWTLDILVENNTGGINNSQNLVMGTGVGATDTLDFLFGEVNLPPMPPVDVFDARWDVTGYEGFLRDIRAYEVNDHEYVFQWQAGAGGYPVTISWDPAQLPDGTFIIEDFLGGLYVEPTGMDTINQLVLPSGMAAYPYLKITCHLINNANQIFQLDDGWNLVSLPVEPDYNELDSLFTDAISAFWFDPDLPGYDQVTSLDNGKGYWLEMPAASTSTVIGNRLTQLNVNLKEGWNLVGTILETIDVNDLSVNPSGSLISVFGFDGSYYNAASLISGNGYWMEVSQDCQVSISQSLKENTGAPFVNQNESWSNGISASGKVIEIPLTLTTGDMTGVTGQNKVDLSFGVHPNATQGVDAKLGEQNLPPKPPAGVFDARFEMDVYSSSVVDLRSANGKEHTYTLRWQAAKADYPVKLTWDKKHIPPDGKYTISDAYGGVLFKNMDMRKLTTLEIPATMSFIDGLVITATFPAVSPFKDDQVQNLTNDRLIASPNPFSSNTVISLKTAENSSLLISIMNKSGQTIWKDSGYSSDDGNYHFEWNGTDNHGNRVAPGMYFCNIRTERENKVIKLIVLD